MKNSIKNPMKDLMVKLIKKLITALTLLIISSCATQQIKPEVLQRKLALGMTAADVIATQGIPNEKKSEEKNKLQLIYDSYTLNFVDNKLNAAQLSLKSENVDLQLKPVAEQNPDYKPDSIVVNKTTPAELSPYYIAGYLKDEALFERLVEAGISRNGFTVKSNALCVALTEGFAKGLEAVLKAGYNTDLQLRTDRGTYVFPESCVSMQKDTVLAEQFKKRLSSQAEAQAPANTQVPAQIQAPAQNQVPAQSQVPVQEQSQDSAVGGTTTTIEKVEDKKEDSKSSFDWQEVKDFLKPQLPTTPSRINR